MPISYDDCIKSAEFIQNSIGCSPKIAVVLGSGLGFFSKTLANPTVIPYKDIPCFPETTVKTHEGRLYCGIMAGKPVYALSGRFHHYEGFTFEEAACYVRVLKLLDVETLILTNAAGSINRGFSPGSLMMVADHINLSALSPCTGSNDERFGPRFFDMASAYCAELRKLAAQSAERAGIKLHEGVYAYMSGPQYETPAEIRALRILGADAVGMSTVPEAIEAAHCGLKTLCISCITNYAAGITGAPLSDDEVVKTAMEASSDFSRLLTDILRAL